MNTVDETKPGASWEFNKDVADVFDNMLERSISGYQHMRHLVTDIGMHILDSSRSASTSSRSVCDLGSSRGEALLPFIKLGVPCYANEVSVPMLDVLKERFSTLSNVTITNEDLRETSPVFLGPSYQHSLVLSVLTLMFLPPENRMQRLADVHRSLKPGGAFIFVEKVIGETPVTQSLLVSRYYAMKKNNGYSQQAIEDKRLSLRTAMWPLTPTMNESMLRTAGFTHIECFFRSLCFCGWVAIKS